MFRNRNRTRPMHFIRLSNDGMRQYLHDVLHLDPTKRLLTKKAWKHFKGVGVGLTLMAIGTAISVFHFMPGHVFFADLFGYLLHGIGAFPIVEHTRPLWVMLTSD